VAGTLLASIPALADPSQDEGSQLILDCNTSPTPGVVSPCAKIYDHISKAGWGIVLSPKTSSGVCAAVASTDAVPGVSNAVRYVEAQGFSYVESVALVIQLTQMDCPSYYPHLVTWANTPWSQRGMT
jgi:hypothetical protein